MGPVETTGIVIVTVAIIQGLIKLVQHVIDKKSVTEKKPDIYQTLQEIKDKIGTECGLNEKQSAQLFATHNLLMQKDSEGMPLVYFPRQSWGDTQKEIAERLQTVSEMQMKMLGLIERLHLEIRLKK